MTVGNSCAAVSIAVGDGDTDVAASIAVGAAGTHPTNKTSKIRVNKTVNLITH